MTEQPAEKKQSNTWVAVLVVAMLLGLGYCGSRSSDDAFRELTETEAQVVCERRVKEKAGEVKTFRHGITTRIDGGFEVLGRATTPTGEIGFACWVTGESGATSSTVELTS